MLEQTQAETGSLTIHPMEYRAISAGGFVLPPPIPDE
jgi:hypothetical protein